MCLAVAVAAESVWVRRRELPLETAMEMALLTETGLAIGWAGLRRRATRRADCFSLLA